MTLASQMSLPYKCLLLASMLVAASTGSATRATRTANVTLAWNTSIGDRSPTPAVQVAEIGVFVPLYGVLGNLTMARFDARTGSPLAPFPISIVDPQALAISPVIVGEFLILSWWDTFTDTVGLQATSIATNGHVWTLPFPEGDATSAPAGNHAKDLVYVCVELSSGNGFAALALHTATGDVVYNVTIKENCQTIAPLMQADGTEAVLVLGSASNQPQLLTANLSHRIWNGSSFIPSSNNFLNLQPLYRGALFDTKPHQPPVLLSPPVILLTYYTGDTNHPTVCVDPATGATKWILNNTASPMSIGVTTTATMNGTEFIGLSLHDGSYAFGQGSVPTASHVTFVHGSGYVVAHQRGLTSFDESNGALGWKSEFPMTAAPMWWTSMGQEHGGGRAAVFAAGLTLPALNESVVMRFDIA